MATFFQDKNSTNIFAQLTNAAQDTALDLKELVANTTEAATEKHIPEVTVDGNVVKVHVGSVTHPMLEEHFITGIYIETEKGYQFRALTPEDEPSATFVLAEDDKLVAAYEYCNLHGLWKKEV